MSTRHTPPPWKVMDWPRENYAGGMGYVIVDSRGRVIASMCQKGRDQKALANAKVLAAAADMAELLKQLEDEYRPDAAHDEAYYPVWALFDAVMKKAGSED